MSTTQDALRETAERAQQAPLYTDNGHLAGGPTLMVPHWERLRWPGQDALPKPGCQITIGRNRAGQIVPTTYLIVEARCDSDAEWVQIVLADRLGS